MVLGKKKAKKEKTSQAAAGGELVWGKAVPLFHLQKLMVWMAVGGRALAKGDYQFSRVCVACKR